MIAPEVLESMTLAELEAIAARFGAAVATIREAQALLGGGSAVDHAPVVAANRRPPTTKGAELSPAEIAQREALMAMRTNPNEYPPDIAKVMGE